jgi:hypothetical protein
MLYFSPISAAESPRSFLYHLVFFCGFPAALRSTDVPWLRALFLDALFFTNFSSRECIKPSASLLDNSVNPHDVQLP